MSAQAALKEQTAEQYDLVPYSRATHPATYPANLYAVGTLFGLTPPDFKTARILELGCASGGNLFPLALLYPKAKFTGLDLSRVQIEQANQQKAALKLSNVEFLQQDLMTFKPKKGEKYDYIIAHGLLSWVPEPVQEKIFQLFDECLSDSGLALVSYNTLPGWGATGVMRDMMLFHTAKAKDPVEKVTQAHSLLAFLAEHAPQAKKGWRHMLEDELALLHQANDGAYLYHDHLEQVNKPFYLYQVVERARANSLEYVADTHFANMYIGNLPPKAADVLKVLGDVVAQEQYIDFICNRRFRSSIFCRNSQKMTRTLQQDQIMNYHLTLGNDTQIVSVDEKKEAVFRCGEGTFTISGEIGVALMLELHAQGNRPIAAEELVRRIQKKKGIANPVPVREALIGAGMTLVLGAYMRLYADCPPWPETLSEKPEAFALTRYEATLQGNKKVTCVSGQSLNIDDLRKLLLTYVDGTHTRAQLTDLLIGYVLKGELTMNKDGAALTDEKDIRREMAEAVPKLLEEFRRFGLLVA